MDAATENGWVKISDEPITKEKDIQAISNMINKDKSGSLSIHIKTKGTI